MESKLHMLKFVHCFLKKFVPERMFEMLESDTDSIYCAFRKREFRGVCPPSLKTPILSRTTKLDANRMLYYSPPDYIHAKVSGQNWIMSPCCEQHFKYQKRTPGLFKLEFSASKAICLSAKCHFFEGSSGTKQVSKGSSLKTNKFNFSNYQNVLETNQPHESRNKGFMCRNHHIFTYEQRKRGLTSFYCKREVLDDGVHTKALNI